MNQGTNIYPKKKLFDIEPNKLLDTLTLPNIIKLNKDISFRYIFLDVGAIHESKDLDSCQKIRIINDT
jgi:hypothetical protein